MDIPGPIITPTEQPATPEVPNRRRLNSTILAGGAAVAMMLAGLGIAGAQTGETTPSEPPAVEKAPHEADERHGKDRIAVEGVAEDCDGKHRRGGGHGRHHKIGIGLDVAARAIGIPMEDLMTALRSGQSIAEVARSKSVDPAKVVEALTADAKQRLQAKVESGDITQAQADERLAKQTERFEKFVNRTWPGHDEKLRVARSALAQRESSS